MRRRPLALALPWIALLAGCTAVSHSWNRLTEPAKPSYRRISPAVAYEVTRDAPNVLILDLRRPDEFQGENGHLPRAWNVPLAQLKRRLGQLQPYREETLLVYCRGGDACGEDGVNLLLGAGFDDAMLIDGGFEAWSGQGFKVVLSLSHSP